MRRQNQLTALASAALAAGTGTLLAAAARRGAR
jgi:hypothetical protein